MAHASSTVTIDRPIGEVFAFFADAENDPQWRSGVMQIHRHGEVGVGARYDQQVAGPLGRSVNANIEVTAYEPGTRVVFHGTSGPVRPTGAYTFRSGDQGTEVTFTLDAELTGIRKVLMGRMVQKTMDSEVAGLERAKAVLEKR